MYRKTKLMRQVEERLDQPLERALPRLINELGHTGTAEEIGVSKATLGYWMLKLGIHVRRVALTPGDSVIVKKTA